MNGLIAGFKAALPGGATTWILGNKSYTQADLLTMLAGLQNVLAAVPAAEMAHSAAVQARGDSQDQITSVIENATAAVRGALGSSPTALAPYGLKPIKTRAPLTAEQNVARAAKAAATRKARGTLGKKQKAAIKGVVPAAAPAAAAAPATPATPAPTAGS